MDTGALEHTAEWVCRRWNYHSFDNHLAGWLWLFTCLVHIMFHWPGSCFFLVICDLITQKPLTMNCHNQTLGADAKKSKERTWLHLLILQWKRKWMNRRKTTLVYSHGTCINLLTPSSSDWIVNAQRRNLSGWWKNN